MAVTGKLYGLIGMSVLNKEADLLLDDVRVMLCTSSYVPNQDTHDYIDHVTNEVVGVGYTAGGKALTGKVLTYDPATNKTTFAAANVTWDAATITARIAVLYVNTGSKPVLAWMDFGENRSSAGDDFTIAWGAGGIFTFTTPA